MTTYITNKNAGFNYEIKDTLEAGISLLGSEVKSIKQGQGSLKEAFVIEEGGNLVLVKSYIPPYQPGNPSADHDPYRKRSLLLKQREIAKFLKAKQSDGLTLIPIRLYNKGRLIKLEIALARGKQKQDKRETIKKRDLDRELGRKLKNRG